MLVISAVEPIGAKYGTTYISGELGTVTGSHSVYLTVIIFVKLQVNYFNSILNNHSKK